MTTPDPRCRRCDGTGLVMETAWEIHSVRVKVTATTVRDVSRPRMVRFPIPCTCCGGIRTLDFDGRL